MSKRRSSTDKTELVETHNLLLALQGLKDGSHNGYDTIRWRRALYHALQMAFVERVIIEKIRIALELP